MIKRCHDSRDHRYSDYGGRGIQVCEEWRNDRYKFYKWCLDNGIAKELKIDRIDNDGNYEPSNCKFSTNIESANNTRKNVFFDYNGKRQTVAQWAREYNLPATVLIRRIKAGWNVERALKQPRRMR